MKKVEYGAPLAAFVKDKTVLDGDRFWVVTMVGDGTYLAAWVDGEGLLVTRPRRSVAGAVKLAKGRWGT